MSCVVRLLPASPGACCRDTSRFFTSACAFSRWLSASISGASACAVFSAFSDCTALPIAEAAAVIASSSDIVWPALSVSGWGWVPAPGRRG